MATYEELMAKARALAADGRAEDAKRVAQIAVGMKGQDQPADIKPNPDGTSAGSPPWGYVGEPGNYRPDVNGGGRLAAGARNAFQGMTFGFGDEIVAGATSLLPGRTYEAELERERERLRQNKEDYPGLSTAGELGGAVATALLPVGAGAQAASRAGQAVPRAASVAAKAPLASRMAGSMAAGAGLGGLYGFGAGEGGAQERAKSALAAGMLGAGTGAAVPLVGAGVQKALNARAGRRAIREAAKAGKTTSELFDEGEELYKRIADADVRVKPTSAVRGYGDVAMGAAGEGADRVYPRGVPHPTPAGAASYSLAKDSAERAARQAEVPFADIHRDSKIMRNIAGSNLANREDTRVAQTAKEKLDNWILGLSPDDVTSGDVAAMTEALPKARDTWSRARKSQLIDDAVERGQNYLSGGASGIKNRIKTILNNPKLAGQFSEAERAAMRRVVDGTPVEKIVDTFGSGLGQMATMATGGAVGSGGGIGGGLAGTLVGAGVGQGARRASEAFALRNAELARAAIASGQLTGSLPVVNPQTRAIIEQLLRGGMAPAVGN